MNIIFGQRFIKTRILVITLLLLVTSISSAQSTVIKDLTHAEMIDMCRDSLVSTRHFFPLIEEVTAIIDEGSDDKLKVEARELVVLRYYLEGNTDSLQVATERLKEIARKYNQLDFYYTSWGYLINNYIMSGMTDHAIADAKKMQEEAIIDNYQYGIASSTNALGETYLYMGLYEEAILYFNRAITEMPDNQDFLTIIADICYSMNVTNINLGRFDDVFPICDKLDSIVIVLQEIDPRLSNLSYNMVSMCSRTIAYSRLGQFEKAKEYLAKVEDFYEQRGTQTDYYYETKATYYEESGQTDLAIDAYNSLIAFYQDLDLTREQIRFERRKANALNVSGNYKEAYDLLEEYNTINDSLTTADTYRQLNELAVLNDLQSAELKNKSLELEFEQTQRKHSFILSLCLFIIIIIITYTYINQIRQSNKLRISELNLLKEKKTLLESEQKLKEALYKANESDRLKSAFLANLSHEIRTPLNAIVGFSDLITMTKEESKQKKYSEIIGLNSSLLLKLINDILDLSKIESGIINFEVHDFDMVPFLDDIYNTWYSKVDKNVRLEFDKPFKKCIISFDINRATQIINNLISNASKFTHDGYIKLTYRKLNEGIEIKVIDTGIGMSPEQLEKIYDRFYKANDFSQGTGLGMAINKAIIDSIGGTVSINSKVGQGTTFTVWFPCKVSFLQPFNN